MITMYRAFITWPQTLFTADVIVKKEKYLGEDYAIAIRNGTSEVIAKSTDHASVIQSAINAVENNGSVFIASGKYELSRTIVINKRIKLAGSKGTILVQKSDIDVIKLDGSGSYGSYLAGFKITSAITPTSGKGIVINGSTGNIIEDIEIEKVYIGIYVYGSATGPLYSYFNTIRNVDVHNCVSHGIMIDGDNTYNQNNLFINVRSRNNGGDGIYANTSTVTIIEGELAYNGGYGFNPSSALLYALLHNVHMEGNSSGNINNDAGLYKKTLVSIGGNPSLQLIDHRYGKVVELQLAGYYDRVLLKVSGTTVMQATSSKMEKNGLPLYTDCGSIPASGDYTGESLVCYDSANAKWVLKVWDGSAWQTIG